MTSNTRRRTAALIVAAAVVAGPANARAFDRDPWIASDKAAHFGVSAGLAAGGYVAGVLLFDSRGCALATGAAVTAFVGISKEALDFTGLGDPSWKDLAWDGIGMASGLLVAWGIDLLVRGVSPRHPLFARAPTWPMSF